MGELIIRCKVSKTEDFSKFVEVDFVIDSGATQSYITKEIAGNLDIKPFAEEFAELADGSHKKFPTGWCWFEYQGSRRPGIVFIGEGPEPLFGQHMLQTFRLVLDFDKHTIKRSGKIRI